MLQSSLQLYRELLAEQGIECEWQERGLLMVHDDPEAFEAWAEAMEAGRGEQAQKTHTRTIKASFQARTIKRKRQRRSK